MCRALRGEKVDVLPAAPAYLSLFLADFERAYYIELYRRRMRGRTVYPVDHEEDTRFRAEALYQSYGIFKVRPDWMEIDRGSSRAWAERTEIVCREDGTLCYRDRLSGEEVSMDQVPLPRGDAALAASDTARSDRWDLSAEWRGLEDVEARLPILKCEELLARGDFELPRRVVADYGERYFLSTVLDTPFSSAYDLLGFQGLMLIQHDRPELLHRILERKVRQAQEEMAAWAAVGIHGVYVEEVFTGADTISPRSYDEFVFAYNRPYFHHLRSLGLFSIHYVCGDVIPRLERIVGLEVDAIAVEESKKAFRIELEDVVERVAGRATVFGNIDTIRFGLHGTIEEMAQEVRRQAAVGARARGFVVSTGSPFPPDTNPRLIDTLTATAHSLPG